jgi:prepilin-type N-terminal cleavage/methylation domain-containing protein
MSNCRNDRPVRSGFSLIEITVAIMLLGVLFVSVTVPFPYALNMIHAARNDTVASYLAQEGIEVQQWRGYDAIAPGTVENRHRLGAAPDYRAAFEREISAVNIDSDLASTTDETGMKRLTVSVFYKHGLTRQISEYRLYSIITDN